MPLLNVHASSSLQLKDVYTASITPMDVYGLSSTSNAELSCWDMGDAVRVVHLRTDPVTLERGPAHIAKSDCDSLILGLNMSGRMYGKVGTSQCPLQGVSASFLPMEIPWTVVVQTNVDHLTVCMSRRSLPLPDSVVERGVMRAIPPTNPYLRVLAGYLKSVEETAAALDRPASETMGSLALELVANMLSGLVGESRQANSFDLLLPAMVHFVRENYSVPELSVGMISARFGVSERYVQRAFAEMDDTPSQMIRRLRIDRARELLANSTRTISSIAGAVGYMDLSTFHRAFKREVGMTPKQWRESSQSAICPVGKRPKSVLEHS